MSLNSIMNIATSGMNAAQTQLRVVSDNVSNVNTPGYVRKIADQQSWASQGVGAGVEIARIRLATDRFLQAASLNASADAGRQTVRYELTARRRQQESLRSSAPSDRQGLSAPQPVAPAGAA